MLQQADEEPHDQWLEIQREVAAILQGLSAEIFLAMGFEELTLTELWTYTTV